jgi:hypothetical protein
VLPARSVGDGVAIDSGSLVFVVPVSGRLVQPGDVLYLNIEGHSRGFHKVGEPVDSWGRRFDVYGEHGEHVVTTLPPKVYRVSRVVPYAGVPFNLFVGPIQSIVLVVFGIAMCIWSEVQRVRAERENERLAAVARSAAEAAAGPPRVTDDTDTVTRSG